MPLFGGADGPKLKLTRPVMILGAVLALLVVTIVVLVVVAALGGLGGRQAQVQPTAAPDGTVQVADTTPLTSPRVPEQVTPPATAVADAGPTAVGTPIPPPTRGAGVSGGTVVPETPVVAAAPTVAVTLIPPPTQGAGVSGVPTAPAGVGGGEASLPASSSGLPWLVPVGAVLLMAVLWWRWRQSRVAGRQSR